MAVTLTISIDVNSQSVANNTSNVTVGVRASWTGGSYNQLQKSGWVTIDGTKYTFTSSFNDSQTTSGTKLLYSKTLNIAHESDGTKTVECKASYTTGVSSGTIGASASKTLTTIPRKSTLSVANGTLGTSQKLTITKQATSFTHTIVAKCGDNSTTVCTKSSSTSINFTPPLSWASNNTSGTTVSVKYTITTYSGSTNVGSNSYTKTCTIPSSVKPSCKVTVSDATSCYSTYGAYVKGQSKFKIVVTPTEAYGSDIVSYKVSANGSNYTSNSFTTDVLKSSGTLSVSATVTDKRGRTSSTATVSVTVLNYSAPVIGTFTVGRCNENKEANDQGAYVIVNYGYSYSSLDGKNSCKATLKYKKTSVGTYTIPSDFPTTATGSYVFPAETGSSYDVALVVTDELTTSTKTTSASTAFTIMHWSSGGRGMGIGKVAELEDVLDIGMQTRFAGGILYPIIKAGTDLNTINTPGFYVGENVSTNPYENCPLTSGTFTLEVISGGDNGQVTQRLTRCHKTYPTVYERTFYTNDWGSWYGGWIFPTLTSAFAVYADNDDNAPRCRKHGQIVEIRGAVAPTTAIEGGTENHVIFTLPDGYRPVSNVYVVCQGSGICTWLLSVMPGGDVRLARYRNGDGYTTAAAKTETSDGTWLPFQVTFIAD